MTTLTAAFNAVAAAAPAAVQPQEPSGWNTTKILGLLATVLGLVIAYNAIPVGGRSRHGKVKEAANAGGVSLISVGIFVLGVGFAGVMAWMTGLLDFVTTG